ncbi:hypothetical protein ACWGK7_18505 (plasmid) [Sphingomonas aurantiaca]
MPPTLNLKTDAEIGNWIRNHETAGKTSAPLYLELLEERARRSQSGHRLDFGRSLEHLERAARERTCTSYGALAAASGVEWSKARHQMNGPNGHLDRLLDICHARGLPMLTAICVNQSNVANGELAEEALSGFVAGARRLGIAVDDPVEFHHRCRDEAWNWGARKVCGGA